MASDDFNAYPDDYRFRGFPLDAMEVAFGAVAPADDWRAPIAAEISVKAFDVTAAAVAFYTATELQRVGTTAEGLLQVKADGYRAGPAGP